jgi:hypothetical protein
LKEKADKIEKDEEERKKKEEEDAKNAPKVEAKAED